MRFLHLSDLHLGKRLCEVSLVDDQRHALEGVLSVVRAERPDAVLIAGDVYDKPIPSAEAVALLDDFLTRLAALGTPVILISGNHDSPDRLAFGARLFSARSVYLSPAFDRDHPTITPVRLQDAFGTVALWPLPFVKPAHVRAALPGTPAETSTDALRAILSTLALQPGERNVLLCHQFVAGGERSESEEIPVGGLDAVDAALFAPFDYVALGHLHRAQSIGRESVRYCGTLLKYSFGEALDAKTVTLVTLGAPGDVAVRTLPVVPLRDLLRLRGPYAQLSRRDALPPAQREAYLHITLTDEADIPDALARLQTLYPNLLSLRYARNPAAALEASGSEAQAESPLTMLGAFYQQQTGEPLQAAQQAYARALLEEIWEGRP